MKVLGLDLETTGLNFDRDRIVEVAAVLYDTELKVPLLMYSEIVNEKDRPEIDPTFEVSAITEEMITLYGIPPETVISDLHHLAEQADYIVAHNGMYFDSVMLEKFFERSNEPALLPLQWLDTLYDIEYPAMCKNRSLMYVAAYHGFLNPFPHRALFDVMTMLRVFDQYDLNRIIEIASSPMVYVVADVSFARKDEAKAVGYRWNPNVTFPWASKPGFWLKEMKLIHVESELNHTFEIKIEDEYQGKLFRES